jgi:queuine tRNA-ribosyltransferase
MSIEEKRFEIVSKDSKARSGVLKTLHGIVRTPVFCPVGTAGAVKGIEPCFLKQAGCSLILANTYHLILRPGVEIIEKLGGIHKFMAWDGPILTDSGGYQVFSLSSLTKINDEGIEFASHIDGSRLTLTAQQAVEMQNRLGADIIMCLDQCPPCPSDREILRAAVDRTIMWAQESKEAHKNTKQMLFGIVQGGTDEHLRAFCAERLVEMDFDGFAVGGLGIGEGHEAMLDTLSATMPTLPEDKPRYLMGVGMPADIVAAVRAGIDIFDCVLPTRNGRNALAFTEQGPLRMRNNIHIEDSNPLEKGCDCYCCQNFSRATVRHFFNSGEMLGPILVSLHNIRFFQRLMAEIRIQIENGKFEGWAEEKTRKYNLLYNSKNRDIKKD